MSCFLNGLAGAIAREKMTTGGGIGNYQDHFLTKLAKKWKTGKKEPHQQTGGRASRAATPFLLGGVLLSDLR